MRYQLGQAVLCLLLSGWCFTPSLLAQSPVGSIEGTVTTPNGVGLVGVVVSAKNRTTGVERATTTNADGEYVLYTYRQGDGAPAGDYVVTIYWPAPLSKKQAEKLAKAETVEEKETIVAPDLLKDAYRTPQKTSLKATVREKDNEIDFKLP